mgnify:CR=1 FL=1
MATLTGFDYEEGYRRMRESEEQRMKSQQVGDLAPSTFLSSSPVPQFADSGIASIPFPVELSEEYKEQINEVIEKDLKWN